MDAPPFGRRRVDPGRDVKVTISARVLDDAEDVWLVAAIPPGWIVPGSADGTASWSEGDVTAGTSFTETVRVRTPGRSPEGRAAFDAILSAKLMSAGGAIDSAAARLFVAPEVIVEHVTFARVDRVTHEAAYLATNAPLDSVGRYDVFRIRFQVRNADTVAIGMAPVLQYAAAGSTEFTNVPVGTRGPDAPFYVGHEWRPAADGQGTQPGPDVEAIELADLKVHDRDNEAQQPATGERVMGAAGVRSVTLAGESYTEIEFTVKATAAILLGHAYEFRLATGGRETLGATVAQVISAPEPALTLSPGQRDGVPVGQPVDATPAPVSEMDFPLVTPAITGVAWPASPATPRYRLAVAIPTAPATRYPLNASSSTSPHAPDVSLESDTCAICHRTHVAQNTSLLAEGAPQATMCFTCHDGAGSSLNVKSQYTDPDVPANDPSTRSYFRHDATTAPVLPNIHVLSSTNEFEGVSNRHSECADCHNSHNATTAPPTQLSSGWTVPGEVAAVSGVAVVDGAATSTRTYVFRDGSAGNQPDREYQLCLKCHSGFTTLPSNTGLPQSQYALDKGVELNPANTSFHPVEAAGTNRTPQMISSLGSKSPYKQWDFTVDGTVRCVHCHGDPRKYSATTPPAPQADLAPHTSPYRGLLLQNYRDRLLKPATEAYAVADFALCYVCHGEAGMVASTRSNTGFIEHSKHLTDLFSMGPGGSSIDLPFAGAGNAICSECHFRIHGTALAVNEGDRSNPRLVNFAPNVGPNGSTIEFTKTATGGTCTLVCHGEAHFEVGY